MLLPSLSKAPNFSGHRPNRRLFARWAHRYSFVVSLLISAIVALAAGPFSPLVTTVALIVFWGYQFIKLYLNNQSNWSERPVLFHRLRAFGLILGTTIFLLLVRISGSSANIPSSVDWLAFLYIPALYIVSRYDRNSSVVSMLLFSVALMASVDLLTATEISWYLFQLIAIKALWLVLLTFLSHVLIRFINDRAASLLMLHDLHQDEFGQSLHSRDTEQAVLERVAHRIATEFHFLRVHVLQPRPDGTFLCVAGAGERGKDLLGKVLPIKDGEGIVGRAFHLNATEMENDVRKSPHYLKIAGTYDDTHSEMAIPFAVGGDRYVLDIQDPRRNVFMQQDREVMETLARQLGQSLEGLRLLRTQREIRKLVESIARQFLGHDEKTPLLNRVLKAAQMSFGADPTVLYEYDPRHHSVRVEALHGELRFEQAFKTSVSRTTHLAYRILEGPEDSYFHADAQAESCNPIFKPDRSYVDEPFGSFIEREGIISRAIFRLRAGDQAVGVLFLNFREPRTFAVDQRKQMRIFADLAALAIQKAQLQENQLQMEREEAGRTLYTRSEGRLRDMQRLASLILTSDRLTPFDREGLQLIVTSSESLLQDAEFFQEQWDGRPSPYLQHELETLTERIEDRFQVPVELSWNGPDAILPLRVVNQLCIIAADIAFTAIRIHEARALAVTCVLADDQFTLHLDEEADLSAFEVDQIEDVSGVRQRIGLLGGSFSLMPRYPSGLRVTISGIRLLRNGGRLRRLEQTDEGGDSVSSGNGTMRPIDP